MASYGADGALGSPVTVSSGGGGHPAWTGDSRRLFYYVDPNKVMSATIETRPALAASAPAMAYDLKKLRVNPFEWDLLPDGRLLAIQKGEGEDDITTLRGEKNGPRVLWGGCRFFIGSLVFSQLGPSFSGFLNPPARIISDLALTPGTRLGVYEVTAQIGEGGMGQVYRATDTKLKRQVAIKILPPSVAADPDRLGAFSARSRSARLAESSQHRRHLRARRERRVTALVMELVEGDDLSQRIARGAIPLDEALPIAKQIAEALEAAHEQGIIHRDLKPANIKVRADGTVKVLDFGLAKAMEPAAGSSPSMSMSPTLSMHATQAGIILGTAAYMSPEQAAGKPVDKRSDLWAFGVVVLEMLTGRPVFTGETVSHVLASVLTREPDWTTLPERALTRRSENCCGAASKRIGSDALIRPRMRGWRSRTR